MPSYARPTDLVRLGLPAVALEGISSDDQQAALDAASATADGYLAARVRLPLANWGDDLRRAVCAIAAYDLMVTRGMAPGSGEAELLGERSRGALAWLRDVADGRVTPTVEETAPSYISGPRVESNTPRGW